MRPTIGVITNPNSKKNKPRPGRKRQLERIGGEHALVIQTPDVDAIPPAVDELLDRGCRYWVSDGGDGALHWMLNALEQRLMERARAGEAVARPVVVPSNGGTIDFVAKKAGIRGHAEDILAALRRTVERGKEPPLVELDTLRVRGVPVADSGQSFDRIGFAAALAGVPQRFFAKYYDRENPDSLAIVDVLAKMFTSFFLNALPGALSRPFPDGVLRYGAEMFAPVPATVEVDGRVLSGREFRAVEVGAIEINLGGVVRTFPRAGELGTLHVQAALLGSTREVALNLLTPIVGGQVKGEGVYDGPARRMRMTADDGAVLDPVIDGEMFYGLREVSVEIGPRIQVPKI